MKKILIIILSLSITIATTYPGFYSYAESNQPSSWAVGTITELKNTGLFEESLFTGYQREMTRLEFVRFLVRTYEVFVGKEIKANFDLSFKDTSDIDAIKAYTIGLTSGVGNGNFAPYMPMDRQTMVTFIIKLMKLGNMSLKPASTVKFADDSSIPSWSKESIYISKANNIVGGYNDNTFRASVNATGEIGMVLVKKMLFESVGKAYTFEETSKEIKLELPMEELNTRPAIKLNEFGRIDFNFKEDDISTTAGKKAFTEKYKLGGYAKAEEIPTYYDLFNVSPFLSSPKSSNTPTCQWTKDELNFYLSNPPTLLGQDGSKPPFGKGIDVLVQWIIDNDKWTYGEVQQPFVHQDGSYLMGQTKILSYDFLELYDNSNNPRILLEPNARIKTQNESPLSSVYIKMILRNYVGEQYVNNAYKIAIFEPVKFQSVYSFGDVELYFDDVSSTDSKWIQIGEPGYKTSELKKVAEYDIALLLGKKAIKPIYYDKYVIHPNPPENYKSPSFIPWN